MRRQPTIERFWGKVLMEGDGSGCWLWTGSLSSNGYGLIWHNGHNVRAHRFAYEYITHAIIPDDKELDHLCRNHQCVNPHHLEVVSRRENVMRGINPTLLGERRSAIIYCTNGHLYDAETTYIDSHGYRACKICKRASNRASYALRKGETDE